MAMDNTAVNRKIFDLGLSVEDVSLYLLCCGLVDAGAGLSAANLLERWNGEESQFEKSAASLEKRGIISLRLSDEAGNRFYNLEEFENWDIPG